MEFRAWESCWIVHIRQFSLIYTDMAWATQSDCPQGTPANLFPFSFQKTVLEATGGGLILTPTPPTQAAGTGTAQGGFCDVTVSHAKSLADTNVSKKVMQQAMTTGKSLFNCISPNGFESILQANLKQETWGESGTLTLNWWRRAANSSESCFFKP